MSATRVIHVDDMRSFPEAVYIGRRMPSTAQRPGGLAASFWANPFRIGDRIFGTELRMTREDVIAAYQCRARAWPEFWARLPELRGKPLACWCRRDGEAQTKDNFCHGDWLVELLNAYTDEELRAMAAPAVRRETR